MKKLVSLLLSLGLIYLVTPVSFVRANNDTIISPQQDEQKFNVRIVGVIPENEVYLVENKEFKFELNFPKEVDINQLEASLEVIKTSDSQGSHIVSLPYNCPIISNEQFTNQAFVEGNVNFEGSTTIKINIKNKENSTILYSDTLSIKVDFGELFVSKNEFNLSTNQLVVYDIDGNPDLTDVKEEFTLGFKRKDGTILNVEDSGIAVLNHLSISNPLIATFGTHIVYWDDEKLLPTLSQWEHYKEFEPFYWQKAKESNSKYTTFNEFGDIIREFQELHGYDGNGIGIGAADVLNGIIARNPGTSYITISAGDESVKIKINVSNLSKQPINEIPTNFVGEFYSDANPAVNVNLTQPTIVNKDIFNASKETGKNTTFNILDVNGNLNYSWTFEGNKVSRTDLDVDLSILKNNKNVSEIKEWTKLSNLLVLNFGYSGELPTSAKIKVYVGDAFKNGEHLYLNYWDSNKKSSSEVANYLTVNDGYVEFTIDHCSTYFLSKEKVNNKNIIIDNSEINDNQGTNVDKPTHDNLNKADVPNTGINANLNFYLILSAVSLMLIGYIVLKKRVEKQYK